MELLKNPIFFGLVTTFIVALPTAIIAIIIGLPIYNIGGLLFYSPLLSFLIGLYFYLFTKNEVEIKSVLKKVLIFQVFVTLFGFILIII